MGQIIFAFILISSLSFADDFRIKFSNYKVSYSSPKIKRNRVSVIVENESLNPIKAKLMLDKNIIHFFSLAPDISKSIEIKYPSEGVLQLVPISPPGESIPLSFNKFYETR